MKICLSCEGVAATAQQRCAHCGIPLLPTSAVHFPIRHGEVDAGNPLLGSIVDDKYRIQGVLGRGGMGTVFRAAHAVSLVPVALKLLHPRLSARPEYRRALIAEARKAGRIVHEQCARVLDVGETEEGTVYLAMELAEGETLDQWVRGGGVAPMLAVLVLEQVCRALASIHAAGLVHRDLSARNVMVAVRDGMPSVKVLDFGIAQSVAMAPRALDDQDGETAFGSPVFSAPEQLAGLDVDARADLYSLGVIAYQLLTGRLPVRRSAARAAAQDTIAGRLEPLPPLPGVPRRLASLVDRCLQRDPAARPASAQAVLAELLALRQGGARWLPAASLAAFAVAVVMALLAHVRATQPSLRQVGGRLELVEGGLSPDARVQYLQSKDLDSVRAYFGGFRSGELVLEITREDELQKRQRLQPTVDRNGVLVLSTAQSEWRDAVQGIAHASVDGPVDVAFVVPGLALLAGARVRIDDEAPMLECSLHGTGGDARITADSVLRWQVADRTGVAALELAVEFADGSAGLQRVLAPEDASFAIGSALHAIAPRCDERGPLQITVRATDRAGNVATPPPLPIAACDVAAPVAIDATGPRGEASIPFLDAEAQLLVQLEMLEPELTIEIVDPRGRVVANGPVAVPGAGTWCPVDLRGNPGDEPFTDGVHTFVVRDAAGNRSESQHKLSFRSRRVDDAFAAGDDPHRAAVIGGEIVVAPEGAVLAFSCSPGLQPGAVSLQAVGDAPAASQGTARVESPMPGAARIAIGALRPGAYRLVVELEEVAAERGARTRVERPLRVLPERLELRLPDVRGVQFLPGLRGQGLFVEVEGALREGPAVHADAELRRYLRGALWIGPEPTRLARLPLPIEVGEVAEPHLFPEVRLLPGRNVCALELRDVLDRDAIVLLGESAAPASWLMQHRLHVIADFHHATRAPALVGEEVRVEHARPVRIEFRTGLPFAADDASSIRLRLASAELAPAAIGTDGDGDTRLAFVLPPTVWSLAGDLANLPRDGYGNGVTARIDGELTTPAGAFTVRLSLRTARSTLRVLSLGEFGSEDLPPALRRLRMIPVLAPVDGNFADPVPHDAPGRGLYRAQPVVQVRNAFDLFLQDREFTVEQYQAVLAALPTLAARADLVHADDPYGQDRLSRARMLPAAFAGRATEFAAAAAASPEAAVAGVDFFQAFTCARVVGVLLADDPATVRLPLGCELELAAFGLAPAVPAARNGASARGGRVDGAGWLRARADAQAELGPSSAQCAAVGDRVPGALGAVFTGLDFGLREWVLDLPQGIEPGIDALVHEWVADHAQHVQRALQFAAGKPPQPDLQGRFAMFAVLRGLPLGERAGLLDAAGAPLARIGDELPASVPGVVRTEQMRRDGRDLAPGAADPRLLRTGFRLAGGVRFVEQARSR